MGCGTLIFEVVMLRETNVECQGSLRQCLPAVARRLAVPRSLLTATQLFFTVPGHIQPVLSPSSGTLELLRHSVHAGTLFYSEDQEPEEPVPAPWARLSGPFRMDSPILVRSFVVQCNICSENSYRKLLQQITQDTPGNDFGVWRW